MFGRPPEGGLLSFRDGVGWTAAKCSGVFQRWTEYERRSLAVCRLRSSPLVGASAAVVRRTILVCGAALQTSSQTYATNLASSLCAPVSRPYPEMQPHLYRIRLSLLAPNVAYLAHLRYLAVESEGSCQKSGGFHQAGEEVVSLNSDWLCLRFSDLAICSGGIETGSINRFHGFWIRRQNYSI